MPSTENWWNGKINWSTPAGQLLEKFLATLPKDRPIRLTLFGSAPLQLTLDPILLSGDVDLFAEDGFDLAASIESAGLGKSQGRFYLEPCYELSFRTSPRWRGRAASHQLGNILLTVPHPLDILIGKLDRLEIKDFLAFKRVIQIAGHPTPAELIEELQAAVDLFRPAFDEDLPNRFPDNTRRLWRELFNAEIDLQREIIAPALKRRRESYGNPADYKGFLRDGT